MIEEVILNLFLRDRHLYEKYYKYINLQYIKNNFTNLYKLFVVLHQHYESSKDKTVSQVDFELVYNSSYLLENSERQELTTY